MSGTDKTYDAMCLRARYAMPGTDIWYCGTRECTLEASTRLALHVIPPPLRYAAMRCAVLALHVTSPLLCNVRYQHRICCYPMLAYAAMRRPVLMHAMLLCYASLCCYAPCRADLGYAATQSGPDLGYAATRYTDPMACTDSTWSAYQLAIRPLACYAMSSTHLGYAPTGPPTRSCRSSRVGGSYRPTRLICDVRY
eukprot:173575-Rhodomonas_salina.2